MRFSPPTINSLSRLQVSQGLLITTERWQHAQTYHRQRQNLHYQSLHQPGVVRGFGVETIPTPDDVQGDQRYHLWLKISPGIAIDVKGNPIIRTEPLNFSIDPRKLNAAHGNPQTVYLVAQYVDPDQPLELGTEEPEPDIKPDKVREDCRFVQRSYGELQPDDVELCRFQLRLDEPQLNKAISVYKPGDNALDFRHRLTACPRPYSTVQVAHIDENPAAATDVPKSFQHLLRATNVLYPALQGNPTLGSFSLAQVNALPNNQAQGKSQEQFQDTVMTQLADYQLTYLPYEHLLSLSVNGRERLRHYLHQGGVVFIVADPHNQPLEEIHQELTTALSNLETDLETDVDDWGESGVALRSQLQQSIDQVSSQIDANIKAICHRVKTFAQQINYPLHGDGTIAPDHPLRISPFTFTDWPTLGNQSLHLFCWNGIVLAVGQPTAGWLPDTSQSRQDIRTAQEWGINLLHYAAKHYHFNQLQGGHYHA